jgi:hypothetical protein
MTVTDYLNRSGRPPGSRPGSRSERPSPLGSSLLASAVPGKNWEGRAGIGGRGDFRSANPTVSRSEPSLPWLYSNATSGHRWVPASASVRISLGSCSPLRRTLRERKIGRMIGWRASKHRPAFALQASAGTPRIPIGGLPTVAIGVTAQARRPPSPRLRRATFALATLGEGWRCGAESNRRIELLQSSALPLGYRTGEKPRATWVIPRGRASAEIRVARVRAAGRRESKA